MRNHDSEALDELHRIYKEEVAKIEAAKEPTNEIGLTESQMEAAARELAAQIDRQLFERCCELLETEPCPQCGRPLEHLTEGVPSYQCAVCKWLWPESFFPKSEE